jgi:ABC-2 type transport system permease protein
MAMGCFASSLTRSQVIAAMMSFLLGVGIWVVSLRPTMENPAEGVLGRVFDHLSIVRHMEDFSRGVLDSRHLVFYLTGTALFVFLTQRVVESRRWK